MKSARGASSLFYLIVAFSFVILVLFIPFPHFDTTTDSWFLSTSIGGRLSGSTDSSGIPLDQMISKVTRASVTSPLDITCKIDSDCKVYLVANQCASYCGNLSVENEISVTQLNNRRICDPALWNPPQESCGCIAGRCIILN